MVASQPAVDSGHNLNTLLTSRLYYARPKAAESSLAVQPSTLLHIPSPLPAFLYDHRSSDSTVDCDEDVRETIRQLEKIAEDLRAMGDEITVPAYARPRLSLRAMMKARAHPAPSLPSPPSDETESVDSHCSSSTTSSSAQYHAPILTGELSFDDMDAERSQQSLAMDIAFGMEIPRIMVTIPSSDELTEDNNRYPSRDSPWRNAGLWDGEPDEVRWVEEYGQWNTQIKRKRGDTSEPWSDSDSDTSSIASSLFITVPDTSSLTTSPPSSPVGYRDAPSTYDTHVRPSHPQSSFDTDYTFFSVFMRQLLLPPKVQ